MDIDEGMEMMRNPDFIMKSWNMYYEDDTMFVDVNMVPVNPLETITIDFTIEGQWFFDIRFLCDGI